jgi:hypothetical protein
MGFQVFPHDLTVAAFAEAQAFSRQNADIICHHFEEVPWGEGLTGRPFSARVRDDWEGKKRGTPMNGKVYVQLYSPGRGDLKHDDKFAPFPKELRGKPYDDPLVKKAYLNYCRRMIDFYHPDYLGIGIEVNDVPPAKWKAYANLHRYVYEALKTEHKDLPISASFALHNILGETGRKREAMLAAIQELMPYNDFIAVSFYPFFHHNTTDIEGCLRWLTDNFDKFNKPYAFSEMGEAAVRFRFPKSGQLVDGTPQKQEAYFKTLLAFAQERKALFVMCFIHRDYDQLWERIKGKVPEVFIAFKGCGLLDRNGKPRPAYRVWKQYFDLPLAQ